MKNYGAYFSYYSEEYGHFDTIRIEVEAADQFEAREAAWEALDRYDERERRYMSCVKLCGVVWDASPLDVQDYFNSLAAYEKRDIKEIENADLRNDEIRLDKTSAEYHNYERGCCIGSLRAIAAIARDHYKALGIIPPDAFEEIHYAKKFVELLDSRGENDAAWELMKRIEKAEKWDTSAIDSVKALAREGSVWLRGGYINLHEYFGRGGVYPEYADTREFPSSYVYRWKNTAGADQLSRLNKFDERHVINGSADAPFEYKTLVLRQERLNEPFQTRENMLWTPVINDGEDIEIGSDPEALFLAENMITGELEEWRRKDFHGILRPEFNDNISFDALKQEYAAENEGERGESEDGQDLENGDDEDEF